jgi:hypothetical protein
LFQHARSTSSQCPPYHNTPKGSLLLDLAVTNISIISGVAQTVFDLQGLRASCGQKRFTYGGPHGTFLEMTFSAGKLGHLEKEP